MPKEIKAVTESVTNKKAQGQTVLSENSTRLEKLTSILLKLVYKKETEGTFSNSLYEPTVTLILKPNKTSIKRSTDQFLL